MYSVISAGSMLAMSGIKTIVALGDNYQVLIKIVIRIAKIGMALIVAGISFSGWPVYYHHVE